MKETKTAYALPCLFSADVDNYDIEDVFFLTFNTKDEREALRLASCVCGKRMAPKSLVIINEDGQVIPT